jgi:hypothetical protein
MPKDGVGFNSSEIRERGDKISKYTLAQLRNRAEEMIGP